MRKKYSLPWYLGCFLAVSMITLQLACGGRAPQQEPSPGQQESPSQGEQPDDADPATTISAKARPQQEPSPGQQESPSQSEQLEDPDPATPISAKVKRIIVEQLGVDETKVTPQASFVDDLGADSLDVVELVMALEEEFGLEISDEDAEGLTTVADAIKYIAKKAN